MTRYCTYCKKMTDHETRHHNKGTPHATKDFKCKVCGSVSINIQGFHEALM